MVTDDHLPPRNIFPKPQPNNVDLITVPACSKCNEGSSRDDEEFKLYISLKSGMEKPHCLKLHKSTKRTIQHNSNLKKRLIKDSTNFFFPIHKTESTNKLFYKNLIQNLFCGFQKKSFVGCILSILAVHCLKRQNVIFGSVKCSTIKASRSYLD